MSLTLLAALLSAAIPAQTPPMGWNSYDCFGYAVNQSEVMRNAEFMATRLKPFGWNYVVIDYVWSCPRLGIDTPNQDKDFKPRLAMDSYGRLLPDPTRFPGGFHLLADRIHKLGLKFGLHLMRGIPRQAVAENTPIEGSSFRAKDAGDTHSPCTWLNHMWGVNMVNGAGQAYLDSIFRLYASWGVDFVKVDDLSSPYSSQEVEGYRNAIDRCGRPVVLSLSPGPTQYENSSHVASHANMWRLLGDFWDNWGEMAAAFRQAALWNPIRKPGHWPDLDMLPLGKLRVYGPQTGPPNTYSRFTENEERSVMTLWCISRAPLFFGGDLPQTKPFTLSLITNREAMAVNQRSSNNRPVVNKRRVVWIADGPTTGHKYLAVFNRGEAGSGLDKVRLSDLGIASCQIKNLWTHHNLGKITEGTFQPGLGTHDAGLYELSNIRPTTQTEPDLDPLGYRTDGDVYDPGTPKLKFGGATHAEHVDGQMMIKNIGHGNANYVQFPVKAPVDGEYVLTIVYATAENRFAQVMVNDSPPERWSFESTGGFDPGDLSGAEKTIHLKAGLNTIRITNAPDYAPDIARIIVRKK